MPGYTVETLAVSGKWVPKDGSHRLLTLFRAAMETFEARLQGQRSRITHWPTGVVVVEIPPAAVYVSGNDMYRLTAALRKLHQRQVGDYSK